MWCGKFNCETNVEVGNIDRTMPAFGDRLSAGRWIASLMCDQACLRQNAAISGLPFEWRPMCRCWEPIAYKQECKAVSPDKIR